jgi:hypothetical protein
MLKDIALGKCPSPKPTANFLTLVVENDKPVWRRFWIFALHQFHPVTAGRDERVDVADAEGFALDWLGFVPVDNPLHREHGAGSLIAV